MSNLPLSFGALLAGAILIDAGFKGDSIANVVQGKATSHPLSGAAGGTSGTSGSAGSSGSGSSPTLPAGSYTNPVPGAQTGRIDQGVDYTLTSKGAVAPGRSKILVADTSNQGWGGGGYVAAQLLDGPLAGEVYYFAEGVAPLVRVGQEVAAGTQLVKPVTNPFNGILGNIEGGWADPQNPAVPLAQSLSGYSGAESLQGLTAGYSFSTFVHALGGVAGVFQGAGQALSSAVTAAASGGKVPAGVPF